MSGATRDTIHAFDFSNDLIKFAAVATVEATVVGGFLDSPTFDADLETAISALGSGHAVLFQPSTGDQGVAGKTFLIVDNGLSAAGYQAGVDLVIELDGMLGGINTAAFIP